MVLATELSSERLPLESIPALGGVAVASWVLAGAMLGDYANEPDPDANPLSDALGWCVLPVCFAGFCACGTRRLQLS